MLLVTPVDDLRAAFSFSERPNLPARWNVAPTQDVPVIRRAEDGNHLALLRWGLVPSWAADPSVGARMINARGESVAGKPAFRDAFRKRRCLVPLDGFYEWAAEGRRKQGYVIRRRDRSPFALAGLWERWRGPKGGPPLAEPLETMTIVTTGANAALAPLHDRMPVVLDRSDWDLWLDPQAPLPVLERMLRPAPDDLLDLQPVGPRVNNVRNDDPSCLDPPPDMRSPDDAAPTLF
ncbi:SOS response-associated peptidase [Azospirillum thermophilum]|uniref:Abasic site processing protein n=1 Tax=Azospirillum thermophilum TaxID=2202148 RepID=A0A2S2CRR8_9PROT|nr:SOS response-associated peptidase [Azospirillum thermophilum]AWK87070.1 DUF159 family protein [Azospirillum thermophilum]